MKRTLVQRIADAVLYEGYILYPYRPSFKNRQRWTFGGLYPPAYCQAQRGSDAASSQTECLVHGDADAVVQVTVRFLQGMQRQVKQATSRSAQSLNYRPVDSLQIGERLVQTWQEAEDRTVAVPRLPLGDLSEWPWRQSFELPGRHWMEPLHEASGALAGVLDRRQERLAGGIDLSAAPAGATLWRLTLRVSNQTTINDSIIPNRDEILLRSLLSVHSILEVEGGQFVSLLDPPGEWSEAAAACRNVGTWPVLVGDEDCKDVMLSAPIILYDYPQIAAESPGDFFDGTEIDEMLALRIMTLTDEEKAQMAAVDPRARELLARMQNLDADHLQALHGLCRAAEDDHA